MKSSIGEGVNALVVKIQEGNGESKKPDEHRSKMSKMRLDVQISRNLDENANCLVEVKHKVESEANS